MRSLSLALLVLGLVSGAIGCAAEDQDDDIADEGAQTIKKKINPSAGNGVFQLNAGNWGAQPGIVGVYAFDDQVGLTLGKAVERSPGSYAFSTRRVSFDDGMTLGQRESVTIEKGKVTPRRASALRVRFQQPVTLGGSNISIAAQGNDAEKGALRGLGAWRGTALGVTMYVLPTQITLFSGALGGTPVVRSVAEGAFEDVVLPTTRVEAQIDAYDADYPTPDNCAAPEIRAISGSLGEAAPVRKQDGSSPGQFVVPAGEDARIELVYYGQVEHRPTLGQTLTSFVLNRLEVNDVVIASAQGGLRTLPGTYRVERKNAGGSYTPLSCTFNTRTGIDVPDGTYRVTAEASSPAGTARHVEEISFP